MLAITFVNIQMVTMVEITVNIIATIPTIFVFSSFWKIYLIPGQRPKGGKRMLTA